jgi:uncharacterized protein
MPSIQRGAVTATAADNVRLVAGLYEDFGRGEVATVLGAMDATIEWSEPEGNPYDPGHPFIGLTHVVEGVFAPIGDDMEGFEIHPKRFLGERTRS